MRDSVLDECMGLQVCAGVHDTHTLWQQTGCSTPQLLLHPDAKLRLISGDRHARTCWTARPQLLARPATPHTAPLHLC